MGETPFDRDLTAATRAASSDSIWRAKALPSNTIADIRYPSAVKNKGALAANFNDGIMPSSVMDGAFQRATTRSTSGFIEEPAVRLKAYTHMRHVMICVVAGLLSVGLGGCRSALYSALESVGIEKRDVLVHRVSDARDAQESAKEQFASALDQFRSVVEVEGGDLERTYDRLEGEYERSRDRAEAVSARIDAVEQVAGDLFDEWKDELDEYSNASLRRDSERLLNDTHRRYEVLMKAMRRAESSMDPVLEIFQDQVLALKHNLNAQAIGGLREELASIERQTASLMKDMERSIAEANEFIGAMTARQ